MNPADVNPRVLCYNEAGRFTESNMGKFILLFFTNSAQFLLLISGIFYLVLSFRGFWKIPSPPRALKKLRFALLLPAYNVEKVIKFSVESLFRIKYPRELFDVFVVADHCTDGTAAIAVNLGATALDHSGAGLKAGKGRALKWASDKILAMGKYDALCYFDADSLAHAGFLEAMNNRLNAGAEAAQGRQLAKNENCWLARILAAGHVITNRFFQRPKQAFGLSATLHGKGMCFSASVAGRFPWDEECLTEDLEMQMRLIRSGVRIAWAEDAIVYDEEPVNIGQYVRRAVRWTRGSLDTARRHLLALCSRAVKKGDIRAFEGAMYCAQTYRFGLITVTAALIWLTRDSFNLFVWLYAKLPGVEFPMQAFAMLPLALYPAAALVMERSRSELIIAYFFQPVLGILRLPVFAAGVLRGSALWGRTEHLSQVATTDLVQ
jgi:cellulose synthase/poly-beta-1,6-N-acetylglucosamine synthase-like glycosyltransferase